MVEQRGQSRTSTTDPKDTTDSENVNPETEKEHFSATELPKAITSRYAQAVKTKNREEAQQLVDEAAKLRGYPKAGFHGTVNGGFTQFDKYYSHIGGNSGAGFYFSSNVDDATGNYSDIEGADNYFKASNGFCRVLILVIANQ